jgi:hypothetical protein
MFTIFVQDGFDRMMGGEDKVGEYATYEEAVARAKGLIDLTIGEVYQPGMTAATLAWMVSQRDVPFIVPEPKSGAFSADKYLRARCAETAGAAP